MEYSKKKRNKNQLAADLIDGHKRLKQVVGVSEFKIDRRNVAGLMVLF